MTLDVVLNFYKQCALVGFSRVIPNVNQRILALYGPVKQSKSRLNYVVFDENDVDILTKIKKTCWISYRLAVKNVKRILKYKSTLEKTYKNSYIEYFVKIVRNKIIITTTIDSKLYKKKLKLRLFSVNNNAS